MIWIDRLIENIVMKLRGDEEAVEIDDRSESVVMESRDDEEAVEIDEFCIFNNVKATSNATSVANLKDKFPKLCGGVMGKYAGGELKPPSVAVVPALLLPPPTTSMDEHLVEGLTALEPYARLFHRYYAIASPSATQRLLLGLLEAPPSWAPDALDAVVQLVELLRAAEDYASGMRLPRNWMHLHFLRAIGTAISMRVGIAADALLFQILSQPGLLFPPLTQTEGVELQDEHLNCYNSNPKSREKCQQLKQQ
ncbi:unnamed protein product [Lactuca virosa]|uniref:Uncharacterized protein n=1 Tax=Lactuca virosa TaxID=75947 RepID=A0AAU9P9P2_9ASTR|nr:unnamed protein product [Lactuca virosa]